MYSTLYKERLVTISQYHKMAEVGILTENERVELINGKIIKKSPVGSSHSSKVKKLNKLLGDKVIVGVQDPIQLNDTSEPEPDISILKYKDNFYDDHHPQPKDVYLLIEVSDSTIGYDKEIKLPLYAANNIPHYWVLDVNENIIEAYSNPAQGKYKSKQLIFPKDKITFPFFNIQLQGSDLLD